MRLLLFLVPIYPDLTGVFFSCNLLVLLHDLVKKLFSLNFILLFERLVCHHQVFVFALGFQQLPSLHFVLLAVGDHHLVLLQKLVFHIPELLFLRFYFVFCFLPQFWRHLQVAIHLLEVSSLFGVNRWKWFVANLKLGVLLLQTIRLICELFDFVTKFLESDVSVALKLIDSNNVLLENRCLTLQVNVERF